MAVLLKRQGNSLTRLINLAPGDRVTLIGCGGKTTIMGKLAVENRNKKVLMTTTTKIRVPTDGVDQIRTSIAAIRAHRPTIGIQCLGVAAAEGKIRGMPEEILAHMIGDFDLTLIEGDGSRMLPLKGWSGYEPVVPGFTTHTLGVLTLNGLGKRATEEWVHRLPLFLKLTGLASGDIVGLEHLAQMVYGEGGMFQAGQGRFVLLINQIEEESAFTTAVQLGEFIRRAAPSLLDSCLIGSGMRECWYQLW